MAEHVLFCWRPPSPRAAVSVGGTPHPAHGSLGAMGLTEERGWRLFATYKPMAGQGNHKPHTPPPAAASSSVQIILLDLVNLHEIFHTVNRTLHYSRHPIPQRQSDETTHMHMHWTHSCLVQLSLSNVLGHLSGPPLAAPPPTHFLASRLFMPSSSTCNVIIDTKHTAHALRYQVTDRCDGVRRGQN